MRPAAALLLLLAPLTLSAQRYDDMVTVNVVEVPVYVERFGQSTAGLTREDFELYVNGERHAIEYFDVLDDAVEQPVSASATAAAPQDLNRRRLSVLVFDVGGSSARGLYRARRKAVEYLDEAPAGDVYAVATVGRSGLRFVVPFTSDRVAVKRAIATLAPSQAADPFRVAMLETERGFWTETMGRAESSLASASDFWGRGTRGGFTSSRAAAGVPAAYQLIYDWELQERFLGDWQLIEDLNALADRMAPLSGIKHVVLLSERTGLYDIGKFNQPQLRLHRRFRAAGVVLDGVDIRPPMGAGITAEASAPPNRAPMLLPSEFLYSLALDTGGTVANSLHNLRTHNRITYVLGFTPPRSDRKTGSIRVKVKNQPWLTEVRYRSTYSLAKPARGDDSLFLADTLLNDIPQNGLTVDLDVKDGWVAASIPGAELLARQASEPVPVDVFFYVFDAEGQATAWSQFRIAVDVAKGREFLEHNPYTMRQEFKLQPGQYAAKVLVRIAGTDAVGFERTDFTVQ